MNKKVFYKMAVVLFLTSGFNVTPVSSFGRPPATLAIDQEVEALVNIDAKGTTRPQGPACDLGLDEYVPVPLSAST